MGAQPVVVVGAGVSGLTAAICLAEAGWPVRVWAAAMPARTTSAVAGAVWAPRPREPVARTIPWAEDSLRVFRALAAQPGSGVQMSPALAVGEPSGTEALSRNANLIPDLRVADEIPAGYSTGFHATLPMIDMPQYLGYLTARLAVAGVDIEARTVRSLGEAADAAPIVVNCAGLGAASLAGDDTLRPVFGQHVVLSNPGLSQLFLELHTEPEWTCFFPHPHRVVCGGISIPGRWDTAAEPGLTERILERCRRVEPRLGGAEVIETITGLRPDRPSVRLEAETLPGGARLVHNYGHGGDGVTLSWGCAHEVVRLLRRG